MAAGCHLAACKNWGQIPISWRRVAPQLRTNRERGATRRACAYARWVAGGRDARTQASCAIGTCQERSARSIAKACQQINHRMYRWLTLNDVVESFKVNH